MLFTFTTLIDNNAATLKTLADDLMQKSLATNVKRREVWAWAMYDFANSGYTTVVITAIFNAYFVAVIAGNAPWATFVWTLSLATSYALVMFVAPLIGAYADAYAAKKKLLVLTTTGCVIFTATYSLRELILP